MKPIHHAMVSARLFGGKPEDYLKVHNAFDMSKAALADMRHRAALHSVDHGLAVMKMIFPDTIGQATLEQVCIQHVNDDQGFDVTLDTWLEACEVPNFIRIRRKPPTHVAGFDTAPEEAAARVWGGAPEDFADICRYYRLAEAVSDHPLAPAVSLNAFAIYFSELAFGAAIRVRAAGGREKYVPVRDIGERMAIARFGRIPTLGEVFSGMAKQDWMLGSRVPRSRKRRCARAGRHDLFSEEMEGLNDVRTGSSPATGLDVILAD